MLELDFNHFLLKSITFMINTLRSLIALDSPIRVFYHFLRGFLAHHIYGDPARDMIVI